MKYKQYYNRHQHHHHHNNNNKYYYYCVRWNIVVKMKHGRFNHWFIMKMPWNNPYTKMIISHCLDFYHISFVMITAATPQPYHHHLYRTMKNGFERRYNHYVTTMYIGMYYSDSIRPVILGGWDWEVWRRHKLSFNTSRLWNNRYGPT